MVSEVSPAYLTVEDMQRLATARLRVDQEENWLLCNVDGSFWSRHQGLEKGLDGPMP